MEEKKGFWQIVRRCFVGYASEPVYWVGFFLLPLFLFFFLGSLMKEGLPEKIPAAIVDMDHTSISRMTTENLASMQLVDLVASCESYSAARDKMQRGEVFGYFVIPRNFQQDLLAGRGPTITFYTNMTYFVPGSLLYKTFKTTAVYLKAGVVMEVAQDLGISDDLVKGMLMPINIDAHGIGNPWLNYTYYLCNSFMPGCLQLMILIMTTFTLGQNVKYGRTKLLMEMGGGSIFKVVGGILLPQTVIWILLSLMLESWMFGWNGYPMNGSWFWITLSMIMYVLACQGLGVTLYAAIPNLRLAVSASALIGILTFSLAAYSFPYESMYPAIGIFSWILPARYNFLIYIDQALNGREIYYSRLWYVAYIIFMVLPIPLMWRIKRDYQKPVYMP